MLLGNAAQTDAISVRRSQKCKFFLTTRRSVLSLVGLLNLDLFNINFSLAAITMCFKTHLWPWTTKPVLSVYFSNVCYDKTTFGWDTTICKSRIWGCQKKSKYWENVFLSCPNEVLSNAYYQSKIKFWYIYGKKVTKYLHGTWSLINILMICGIKEKLFG